MLEIINFVFTISASMASSSRWGSYCDSADNGCLEKVADLWLKISSPRLVTLRGQRYFVARPGFGCTSLDIWRSRSRVLYGRLRSGFVVTSRISSAAAN